MYYIRRSQKGLYVVKEYQEDYVNMGLKKYLNELMLKSHVTLNGRLDALKKRYKLTQNIPIYINESICFYTTKPLREYETICINFCNVLSLRERDDTNSEIIFKNLKILKVNIPYSLLIKKHAQTARILDQINKTI